MASSSAGYNIPQHQQQGEPSSSLIEDISSSSTNPFKRPFPLEDDDSDDQDLDFTNLGDDERLSGAVVQKMLRRMQKLEGKVKRMRQERAGEQLEEHGEQQYHGGLAHGAGFTVDDLLSATGPSNPGPNFEQSISGIDMAAPFNTQLSADGYHGDRPTIRAHGQQSDGQALAPVAYTYNVTNLDGTVDPTLQTPAGPPSHQDGLIPGGAGSSAKTMKRRGKAKSKRRAEELATIGNADHENSLSRIKDLAAKKIKTPELNRAVLKRLYQLLDITDPKQNLPHPYDPSSGLPNPNEASTSTAGSQGAPDPLDQLGAIPTQEGNVIEMFHGKHMDVDEPQEGGSGAPPFSNTLAYAEGHFHDSSVGPAENAAAAVLHMVMAAQQHNNGSGSLASLDEFRIGDEGVQPRAFEQDDSNMLAHLTEASEDLKSYLVDGKDVTQASKKRTPSFRKAAELEVEPPLDENILAWKGFVPNWLNKHEEKNAAWCEAIAASVLRCPPLVEGKYKNIPLEHRADVGLALIAAKTSFGNMCEKYKRQNDPEAQRKGAQHKRLTRRKGRRAEKLMRRTKARESEEFAESQWKKDHDALDISQAFDIDAMSSEYSDDEEDPVAFQNESDNKLPDVDRTRRTVLEVRTPAWQSEELATLWETLDELYPKILRKINPEHFFAPAHPRFKRKPFRDVEPKRKPGAGWMVNETWLKGRNSRVTMDAQQDLWVYAKLELEGTDTPRSPAQLQ